MLKVAQIISRNIQNIATMLYHQVAIEESSGLQQSAEQLLIILGMFARISRGHQNQFIYMFAQNTLFQVSDFFKKNDFKALLTLSIKD